MYANTNCVDKQSPLLYFTYSHTNWRRNLYENMADILTWIRNAASKPTGGIGIRFKVAKETAKAPDGIKTRYQKRQFKAGDWNANVIARYYHGLNGFRLDRQRSGKYFP